MRILFPCDMCIELSSFIDPYTTKVNTVSFKVFLKNLRIKTNLRD